MNEKQKTEQGADSINSGAQEDTNLSASSREATGARGDGEVLGKETEGERAPNKESIPDSPDRLEYGPEPRGFGFANFVLKQEKREKTAFYASDFGKATLDLYFSLTGEPVSNPMQWDDTIRLEAGKGVETALVKVLKDSGFVPPEYEQKSISINREGVEIHGKIDAVMFDGVPIEIKSVNNKNVYDVMKYQNNEPRESYVGQLAIYMDALDKDIGYLFAVTLDGLNKFLIPCIKTATGQYRCGKVTIDLQKEYKRWSEIWNKHIVPKVMPSPWEFIYKPPIDEVDWKKVPLAKRRAAAIDGVVVGSAWQVLYSPWKNRICQLQGTVPGYTEDEKLRIREILSRLFAK